MPASQSSHYYKLPITEFCINDSILSRKGLAKENIGLFLVPKLYEIYFRSSRAATEPCYSLFESVKNVLHNNIFLLRVLKTMKILSLFFGLYVFTHAETYSAQISGDLVQDKAVF